ncbi:MAG: glycosyltransferase family 4 protein, partial [Actinomycetota bacterium]
ILMLAHNVSERGSAIRALSIARWLAAAGREVTVVSGRRRVGLVMTRRSMDGVRLLEVPDVLPYRFRNGGLSPIDLAGRLLHVLRERYDVVHTFEPRPSATVPGLLAQHRGKCVWVADWADLWGPDGMAATWPTPQRVTLGAFDGLLQSYTRRRADAVTVISSDLEQRAAALGIPPERIRRIAVGANDDLFRPQPAAEARLRFGIPLDALVLVHTGFAPFDDWLLAHTFAEIASSEPRAYLLMSGRRFPLVEERAAAVGAAHRVVHAGVVPYRDLGSVMACGDVMVVPYTALPHNEARFPNRAGDYLAAGRPIATNPTGDLGRLVATERIGIVAPATPETFALAILDLLRQPAVRDEMGSRARTLAETTLSWRAVVASVGELYDELVELRS